MIKKIFSLSLVFFFVFCFYSLSEAVLIQGSVKDINLKTQQVEGVPFVPLIQVCDANGVSYAWDSLTSRVRLYLKGDQLVVTVNEKVIDLNGEIKFLSKPVRMVGGAVMVPQSMLELPWWGMKKKPMLEVVIKKASPYSIDSIILDPGHGGKDRGAVGTTGLKEKELVLHEILGFAEPDTHLEVQATLDLILKNEEEFANIFYEKVFNKAPEVRDLFKKNMLDQGRMLTHMLGGIIYKVISCPKALG